jgi:tRNA (guanine-N7-)-methyltransferase
MRLRNVKRAYGRIDDYNQIVKSPETFKGKWHELFQNNHDIHIEIGMGRGQFLIEQAKRNPHINYIGFEKYTVVIVKALDKMLSEPEIKNLVVVRYDAQYIRDLFEDGEVAHIYLNFSDPWPKERHDKRRLTHREFLGKYEAVLVEDGLICLKTDNNGLFDFSLEEMAHLQMTILKETRDLHLSPWVHGNIMTEYEEKFTKEGMTINMVEAKFKLA